MAARRVGWAGRLAAGAVALAVALAAGACGQASSQPAAGSAGGGASSGSGGTPKVISLTVGTTSASSSAISFMFHVMLNEPQFLKQVGLKLSTVTVQMGQAPALVQAGNPPVLEGTGQISVAEGYAHGATAVKGFLGELQKPAYYLVVRKGITSLKQIKVLGVPSVYSASAMNCEAILRTIGEEPNTNYSVDLVGPGSAEAAAVQAGKIDGSCVLLPYPQVFHAKYGLPILATAAKYLPYYASGMMVYNTNWAKDPTHHEALVRFAEAFLLTAKWAFDPANKSQVVALAAKQLSISNQFAQDFYNAEIGQQWTTPDGYIPKAAALGDSQDMVHMKLDKTPPNPSQYWNWSILQEAAGRLHMTIRKPSY